MATYLCNKCSYKTTSKKNFELHNCSSSTYKCVVCGLCYNNKPNLSRHKKTCLTPENKDEKIKKLEEELKSLKKLIEPMSISNTLNSNNTSNNNIQINLTNYREPSIAHITNEEFYEIVKNVKTSDDVEDAYMKTFKLVHLNPNVPQNHTLFCTDKNYKTLEVYEKLKGRDKGRIKILYDDEFKFYVEDFENNVVNKLATRLEISDTPTIKDKDKMEHLDSFDNVKFDDSDDIYYSVSRKMCDILFKEKLILKKSMDNLL